jgi:hypothetical protein
MSRLSIRSGTLAKNRAIGKWAMLLIFFDIITEKKAEISFRLFRYAVCPCGILRRFFVLSCLSTEGMFFVHGFLEFVAQDMCVNLCGCDICVTQHFLNSA